MFRFVTALIALPYRYDNRFTTELAGNNLNRKSTRTFVLDTADMALFFSHNTHLLIF